MQVPQRPRPEREFHELYMPMSHIFDKLKAKGLLKPLDPNQFQTPYPKKEPLTLDGFEIEKPGFEKREEEVEKIPIDFTPYGNNNVVAMIRRMNYFPRMNLGKVVKKPNVQDLVIPTTTPRFGLGYKPTDDNLLEMEVRKMARAKAEAKGLPCPLETETLHSYIEWEKYDSPYSDDDWDEPSSDREDEDADLFYEEYDSDVDYYDEDIESDTKANRWSDTDSDQYRLINVLENAREDNAQANQMYHDEYPYGYLSDYSDVINVSSRSGPRYNKHGREVLELGSYYDLEPSTPTPHTEEKDDIDVRLAALDQKMMVHSLKIMTLENAECNVKRREEGGEPEYLPQPTDLGNRGKYHLFDEWMDSIERLDAFGINKPTNMEIEKEDEGRRSLLRVTCHCGSHDRVEELGMGGSRPPHRGLREEDQDRQVSHLC
ncbi:hypothetical protein SO802_006098 [Lithocarpus litseifolius]|uniref:Uncharacterized protein n=1 Tax=Lithocarpus litseifolius TaxID=425828 RepID=A0AAW2DP57_9ROSI